MAATWFYLRESRTAHGPKVSYMSKAVVIRRAGLEICLCDVQTATRHDDAVLFEGVSLDTAGTGAGGGTRLY